MCQRSKFLDLELRGPSFRDRSTRSRVQSCTTKLEQTFFWKCSKFECIFDGKEEVYILFAGPTHADCYQHRPTDNRKTDTAYHRIGIICYSATIPILYFHSILTFLTEIYRLGKDRSFESHFSGTFSIPLPISAPPFEDSRLLSTS